MSPSRLSELRARARRWKKRIGMELLIVDLLGKVSPDTREKDRYREAVTVSVPSPTSNASQLNAKEDET